MIIYGSSALEFRNAVESNRISGEIENNYILKMGKRPSPGEVMAWNNSMQFMERIIRKSKVADDCGVLIEYNIPTTSKRIDFIISGCDERESNNFVIIELKQWSKAEATEKDGIVVAYVGQANREVAHPSYQAWSYRQYLYDMNEAIYSNDLNGQSCVYLHNYNKKANEPLLKECYKDIVSESPLYFSEDYQKLQDFLYRFVGKGKGMDTLYKIEKGKIKPSKKLMDHIDGLFKGKQEFVLLDEQKVAYETIVSIAAKSEIKRTIIVQGGPGTGKSVISMNAFGHLITNGFNVKFVAPNASFRNVMIETLANSNPRGRTRIRNLFAGSGQFYGATKNTFDVLVVDEAHRLKNQGAYQYQGENQVEDIVNAAKVSVFFIDDNQRIRPEDIGSVDEIRRVAKKFSSRVYEIKLNAQFRCAGAEGFINWMDNVLHIKETGNFNGWDKEAFEFEILDTPNLVYEKVKERMSQGFKARMLAGYAWPWTQENDGNKNGEVPDVVIEEHDFRMPWNGRSITQNWAINEEGVEQIGCIHTSQGLEFDYVGVIIGNDLRFDPVKVELYADYEEYKDTVGKKGLKYNNAKLTELVKNIYKVLVSRCMKGCYIYCRDKCLQHYFKERLSRTNG